MDGQPLNESKFLSEQINNDEEPTEEEVIEKAEELGISDLGLAREALTKELEAQWKPYINRRGEVYYINLDDRRAYLDHPVDMEIAITDALRHKKKIPTFREFAIEDISRSPRLINQEISRYQREKGLNVVYEESDEESLRRDTLQSVDEPAGHSDVELDSGELEAFRMEMEREMRAKLASYREEKEAEHAQRLRASREAVEESKRARLTKLAALTEQEIAAKNDSAFQKGVQAAREELAAKKDRLDDLHTRELDLTYTIHQSRQDKQQEITAFYRARRLHSKQRAMQQAQSSIVNHRITLARGESEAALRQFEMAAFRTINARINLQERLYENIERLGNQPDKSKPAKKRHSIFNPDLFPEKQVPSAASRVHALTESLNTAESVHAKLPVPVPAASPRLVPGLLLRMSVRWL